MSAAPHRVHSAHVSGDPFDVGEKSTLGGGPFARGRPKHGGRMHRRERDGRQFGLERGASVLHHAERRAEHRLGCRRAEAEDRQRRNERQLRQQPRTACADFAGARCLVQPPCGAAVPRPFEMFDGVGHVDLVAIDAGGLERAIEQQPGRSHEWMTRAIFGVARLLADRRTVSPPWAPHRTRPAWRSHRGCSRDSPEQQCAVWARSAEAARSRSPIPLIRRSWPRDRFAALDELQGIGKARTDSQRRRERMVVAACSQTVGYDSCPFEAPTPD